MFISSNSGIGYRTILHVDGTEGRYVATVSDEYAHRILELLNREGLTDCSTGSLADALLDLKERQ
jgi:hypothetical protein